jgi:GT2 family glycosyltransferase
MLLTIRRRTEMQQATMPTVFAVIPVFNRLHFTRECIKSLKAQTYRPIKIIVADGGSTDGTFDAIRSEHTDVVVLSSATELWWAGAMAMGVVHALHGSQGADDYVLMMNNDTQIPTNYVDTLVTAAQTYGAAVGALVVDSRDVTRVLDAGEYIDWENYSFPVKSTVAIGERFCDDVDVLPGRGSLVPLRMIRVAGNVDAIRLPHYLADYEFFYRLKQHGFNLGVCYETQILAHIEETGIVPTSGKSSFRAIWHEAFSRRSMSNVLDHWYFVGRHAPTRYRASIRLQLIRRVIVDFTLRTPLRPFFLPLYWLLHLPHLTLAVIRGQRRAFALFTGAVREQGINVLCHPEIFPGTIRLPLYFLASPGPLTAADIAKSCLKIDDLLSLGILRPLGANGWYAFKNLTLANKPEASKLTRLFWAAWNPFRKLPNTLEWRKVRRAKDGYE